jgi:hypothetical protein
MISQNCHTKARIFCYDDKMSSMIFSTDQFANYYSDYEDGRSGDIFSPNRYISMQEDGFAICTNPVADGGLSSITVNTKLQGEAKRNFEASVKRMVLAKLFSPKFAEVILMATNSQPAH